jgi:hypothetical protein
LRIKRLEFDRLKESLKCFTYHELPPEPKKPKPVELNDFIEEYNQTKRKQILENLMREKEKEVFTYILSEPKRNRKERSNRSPKENYVFLEREHKIKSIRSHRLISDIKSYLLYTKKLSHKLEEKNDEVEQALKNLNSFPNANDLKAAKGRKKNFSHLQSLKNNSLYESEVDFIEPTRTMNQSVMKGSKALKQEYFKKKIIKTIYKTRIYRFVMKVCIIELYHKICQLRQFNEELLTSMQLGPDHKNITKTFGQLEPLKELEQQYTVDQTANFKTIELYNFNKKFRMIRFYIETAYLILFKAHDKTPLLTKVRMVYKQINFKILSHLSSEELKKRFCQTNLDITFAQKQHILHEKTLRRVIVEEHYKKMSKAYQKSIKQFFKKLTDFAGKNRYFLKKLAEQNKIAFSESQRTWPIFLAKKLYLKYNAHNDFPIKPLFAVSIPAQ